MDGNIDTFYKLIVYNNQLSVTKLKRYEKKRKIQK